MKLSLKKIFITVLMIAIFSILILSVFSLYFNSRLALNQRYLLEITSIETSRYTMNNALLNFLSRQERMLIIRDSLSFATLPKKEAFNQSFQYGIETLTRIGKATPSIMKAVQALQDSYQAFLTTDQQLFDITKSVLATEDQLKKKAEIVDRDITDIRNKIESISGIFTLANKKIELQVKDALNSPHSLNSIANQNKFKMAIRQYVVSGAIDAQKISGRLTAEIAILAALMRKIIEESNSDTLTDLISNQFIQLISITKNELLNMNNITKDSPDLHQNVLDINNQFANIITQIVGSKSNQNNIIQLRTDLNLKEAMLQHTIEEIQASRLYMSAQFDLLNATAIDLKNMLLKKAQRLMQITRMMILSLALIVLIFFSTIGFYLLRTITTSLEMLSNTMKKIANEGGNLSYRLEQTHYEDLNEVSRSFNTMTSKLEFFQNHLQELVQTKTHELSTANQNLANDLKRRIEMEKEVEVLNQQLVHSARKAGMADVATSVLHNIGNILNSINVSLALLQENNKKSDFDKLFAITAMIKEHINALPTYFADDEKGKLIPGYLIALVNALKNNRNEMAREVTHLRKHIKHIEDIVSMQQSISGISTIAEKVFLPDMIESALQLCDSSIKNNNIHIQKNFKESPFIMTDKSKLIQIFVNLVQNAKDALTSTKYNIPNKIISISIEKQASSTGFAVMVSDNGYGIVAENITKIFSFGFTTKLKGHGFGLHGSALAAKELGGVLYATSEGLGLGATFTLTLPLTIKMEKSFDATTS